VTIGTDGGGYQAIWGGSGSGDLYAGNTLTVGGRNTATAIRNFEFLEFALPATGVSNGDVMLSTAAITNVGIANVSVTAAVGFGIAAGESIVLLNSPISLTPFTAQPVTLNGDNYSIELDGTDDKKLLLKNTGTPTVTAPGAPSGVTATAGNGTATVSFTAPASTGGSPITSYTVTSSPGGLTATGSSSPITISGLTNGTSYTFTVTATNAIGPGPASVASNAVTPTAATVPVLKSLTPADGAAEVFPGSGEIIFAFSEPMDMSKPGTVALSNPDVSIPYTSYAPVLWGGEWLDNKTYRIFRGFLLDLEEYTLTIAGFRSAAGVEMLPATSRFTTGRTPALPVMREVILRSAPGVVTNPPAGRHFVPSGQNFEFIILSLPADQIPAVKTDRATDQVGGVEITPLPNGAYLVVVREIRQTIEIIPGLTTPVDPNSTANAAVETTNVWSSNGQLHIASPTSGTAQVYSLTGQLVKTIPCAAGETASATLAKGLYIVRIDGKTFKVSLNQDL
jgi:hypothetical protein